MDEVQVESKPGTYPTLDDIVVYDEPTILLPCTVCNKTFKPEALQRHSKVCEKSAVKRRKTFDSFKQRVKGTELAEFLPFSTLQKRGSGCEKSPSPKKTSQWKENHEAFVTAIRAARGDISDGGGSGEPRSILRPPDHERCPYCERHFGPKAFDRHQEWCREQHSRQPPSAASVQAKERLEARIKYRAPPIKSKRAITREKYSPLVQRKVRQVSPASQANTCNNSNTGSTCNSAGSSSSRQPILTIAQQEQPQKLIKSGNSLSGRSQSKDSSAVPGLNRGVPGRTSLRASQRSSQRVTPGKKPSGSSVKCSPLPRDIRVGMGECNPRKETIEDLLITSCNSNKVSPKLNSTKKPKAFDHQKFLTSEKLSTNPGPRLTNQQMGQTVEKGGKDNARKDKIPRTDQVWRQLSTPSLAQSPFISLPSDSFSNIDSRSLSKCSNKQFPRRINSVDVNKAISEMLVSQCSTLKVVKGSATRAGYCQRVKRANLCPGNDLMSGDHDSVSTASSAGETRVSSLHSADSNRTYVTPFPACCDLQYIDKSDSVKAPDIDTTKCELPIHSDSPIHPRGSIGKMVDCSHGTNLEPSMLSCSVVRQKRNVKRRRQKTVYTINCQHSNLYEDRLKSRSDISLDSVLNEAFQAKSNILSTREEEQTLSTCVQKTFHIDVCCDGDREADWKECGRRKASQTTWVDVSRNYTNGRNSKQFYINFITVPKLKSCVQRKAENDRVGHNFSEEISERQGNFANFQYFDATEIADKEWLTLNVDSSTPQEISSKSFERDCEEYRVDATGPLQHVVSQSLRRFDRQGSPEKCPSTSPTNHLHSRIPRRKESEVRFPILARPTMMLSRRRPKLNLEPSKSRRILVHNPSVRGEILQRNRTLVRLQPLSPLCSRSGGQVEDSYDPYASAERQMLELLHSDSASDITMHPKVTSNDGQKEIQPSPTPSLSPMLSPTHSPKPSPLETSPTSAFTRYSKESDPPQTVLRMDGLTPQVAAPDDKLKASDEASPEASPGSNPQLETESQSPRESKPQPPPRSFVRSASLQGAADSATLVGSEKNGIRSFHSVDIFLEDNNNCDADDRPRTYDVEDRAHGRKDENGWTREESQGFPVGQEDVPVLRENAHGGKSEVLELDEMNKSRRETRESREVREITEMDTDMPGIDRLLEEVVRMQRSVTLLSELESTGDKQTCLSPSPLSSARSRRNRAGKMHIEDYLYPAEVLERANVNLRNSLDPLGCSSSVFGSTKSRRAASKSRRLVEHMLFPPSEVDVNANTDVRNEDEDVVVSRNALIDPYSSPAAAVPHPTSPVALTSKVIDDDNDGLPRPKPLSLSTHSSRAHVAGEKELISVPTSPTQPPVRSRQSSSRLSADSAYSSLNRRSPVPQMRRQVGASAAQDSQQRHAHGNESPQSVLSQSFSQSLALSSSGSESSLPPLSSVPANKRGPRTKQDRDTPSSDIISATTPLLPKLSKFCHECGTRFSVTDAKFCCECGARRLELS